MAPAWITRAVPAVALAGATTACLWTIGVGPWLGGHQPNPTPANEPAGGWQWVDGTPWSFTSWQTNQPDDTNGVESYLDLIQRGGTTAWNDDSNTGSGGLVVSYVVEFE